MATAMALLRRLRARPAAALAARALRVRAALGARSAARFSTAPAAMERIRNIGILAHIDAGKTTTTERMLFYAGAIARMGEVHDGDATMDFLPQERERGITIGAAAISFSWRGHAVNLLDTPGHVDFTVEVERAVRVLDGAVAVLDGVAGVEAQTETVWEQADRYRVPRVAFVNKLDRDGASFARACASLEARFQVRTLCVQLPVGEEEAFDGVLDLVEMQLVRWLDRDGKELQRLPLLPAASGRMAELHAAAAAARQELIERAADLDEELGELFLLEQPVDAAALRAALRRITLARSREAVVTLCGSALRNKGVQPLLDAVVDYLPSPLDLSPFAAHVVSADRPADGAPLRVEQRRAAPDEPLLALAFKVKHDRQRGLVVFFRVYAGVLRAKAQLFNSSRGHKERLTRLMLVAADDADEVAEVSAGHIGAAVGLKHTFTGDTLVAAADAHARAGERLVLPGVQVPKPVFTCSVEAESSARQKDLDDALFHLQREDPSFVVSTDAETGQTLMSGMGELHLEVIQERLRAEYKLSPAVGAMRVAYLESAAAAARVDYAHDVTLGADRQFARLSIALEPLLDQDGDEVAAAADGGGREDGGGGGGGGGAAGNIVEWTNVGAKKMPHAFALAIEEGVRAAMSRGVLTSSRVAYVKARVDERDCEWDADSSANAFRVAAALAFKQALRDASPVVLEPMMKLEVRAPDRCVGDVLSDLTSQRRAHIQEVGAAVSSAGGDADAVARAGRSLVLAHVPLAHMVGYSTLLRSKTQGEGSFDMQFLKYLEVDAATRERLVVRRPSASVAPAGASDAV